MNSYEKVKIFYLRSGFVLLFTVVYRQPRNCITLQFTPEKNSGHSFEMTLRNIMYGFEADEARERIKVFRFPNTKS